jgi:hypothetical protein
MSYPTRTIRQKIMGFLDGGITKGTDTTPLEILSMLGVLLVFILVYAWLDEIQSLIGRPFG